MRGAHDSIIAAAAKAELKPLGFQRKGRSRLWLADHGTWLNVVEFTPSRWSKGVSLMNASHWLWAGTGFLSFNHALPSNCHAEFESEDQFKTAAAEIAQEAAAKAREIESRFASFDAIRDFVVAEAHASDRMRPSWFGYYAGIASGLSDDFDEAEYFLKGLTDERVTKHAEKLISKIGDSESFRAEVRNRVAQQRATLKLPELEQPPF